MCVFHIYRKGFLGIWKIDICCICKKKVTHGIEYIRFFFHKRRTRNKHKKTEEGVRSTKISYTRPVAYMCR